MLVHIFSPVCFAKASQGPSCWPFHTSPSPPPFWFSQARCTLPPLPLDFWCIYTYSIPPLFFLQDHLYSCAWSSLSLMPDAQGTFSLWDGLRGFGCSILLWLCWGMVFEKNEETCLWRHEIWKIVNRTKCKAENIREGRQCNWTAKVSQLHVTTWDN